MLAQMQEQERLEYEKKKKEEEEERRLKEIQDKYAFVNLSFVTIPFQDGNINKVRNIIDLTFKHYRTIKIASSVYFLKRKS